MLRQTSTVFGRKILRFQHLSTFCCKFLISSLLFRNSLFLCLLRCKFWLESGVVQSYNNRIKSNRLSSDNERRVLRIILQKNPADHITDHLPFRSTRKQWIRECRRARFSERKGAEKAIFSGNCLHRSVWEQDAAGSSPVISTKNQPKMRFLTHFRLIFCLWSVLCRHFGEFDWYTNFYGLTVTMFFRLWSIKINCGLFFVNDASIGINRRLCYN